MRSAVLAVSEIIEAVLWRAFNHQASVRAPPAPDEVCSDDSDQRARPRDRAVRWFAVLESTRREVLLGRAWDAPRPATRTGADSTVGERSDRGPTRDESSVSAVCVCWLTPTLIQVSRLRPGSDCAGRVETGSTSGCKGPLGSSVQGAAWFVSRATRRDINGPGKRFQDDVRGQTQATTAARSAAPAAREVTRTGRTSARTATIPSSASRSKRAGV